MCTDRRDFLRLSAGIAGATLLGSSLVHAQQGSQPEPIRRLRRMTDNVVPITTQERNGRIEKAQKLMRDQRIDAIYIEPGSSMFYYTGMRWGTSERMFAMVIPARGEIAWVCPKFEEERARELINTGKDIRTWEEDESPYKRVAEILKDRGVRTGTVGIEERVRFFLYDGIRQGAPAGEFGSAVLPCCRNSPGGARGEVCERGSDHLGWSHVQVACRTRVDADRERHHDCCLQSNNRDVVRDLRSEEHTSELQ